MIITPQPVSLNGMSFITGLAVPLPLIVSAHTALHELYSSKNVVPPPTSPNNIVYVSIVTRDTYCTHIILQTCTSTNMYSAVPRYIGCLQYKWLPLPYVHVLEHVSIRIMYQSSPSPGLYGSYQAISLRAYCIGSCKYSRVSSDAGFDIVIISIPTSTEQARQNSEAIAIMTKTLSIRRWSHYG